MKLSKYKYIYFIGIGGIGMSALAVYFQKIGFQVAGYDRTDSKIIQMLNNAGIKVTFNDSIKTIPIAWKNNQNCLIIYTPAIPKDHEQFTFFRDNNYCIKKRAEILGEITRNKECIAVAGTHAKTSISSFIAHILYQTDKKCLAFLGGITKNYNSNLLFSNSNSVVVEADEYDRSFLNLSPDLAVVTSMDSDHLDVYGTDIEMRNNYQLFVDRIVKNGILLFKKGLNLTFNNRNQYSYSLDNGGDFFIQNLQINKNYVFDLKTPFGLMKKLQSTLVGKIYLENLVAAVAVSVLLGTKEHIIRSAIHNYHGVIRRFDYQIQSEDLIYIDDYAHHPKELAFTIESIRELYPNKRLCGVFQPHLYSRTKDFAFEFANSLNRLDELILLPIYPAREKPISGVSSKLIYDNIKIKKNLCEKNKLINILRNTNFDILVTFGAGDIDEYVMPIKNMLSEKK